MPKQNLLAVRTHENNRSETVGNKQKLHAISLTRRFLLCLEIYSFGLLFRLRVLYIFLTTLIKKVRFDFMFVQ